MRNSGITDCCQGQRICTVAVFYADEAPQKRPRKTRPSSQRSKLTLRRLRLLLKLLIRPLLQRLLRLLQLKSTKLVQRVYTTRTMLQERFHVLPISLME